METEELQRDRVHHGHNIRRVRREKGIKQETMAGLVDMSQQTVSRYESMQEIDDGMLQRFAKALQVPVELLKMLEEDAPTVIFENNNVITNNDQVATENLGNYVGNAEDNSTKTFNPIDKVIELYERLLNAEKSRNDLLEKRLSALEQKLGTK